jgi:hypothetical protein
MEIEYTKWLWNIPKSRKIDQMFIKYANMFNCNSLQKLPKMGSLVWKLSGNTFYVRDNPTIVSYNASAAKIYNATSSLVRFEKTKAYSTN